MPSFVSLHTLHSVPWSALNTGGDGRPKLGQFGGYTRNRYSSQALKAARRRELRERGVPSAIRTRSVRQLLTSELRGRDPEEASAVVRAALEALGLGLVEKTPDLTQYLLYWGEDEIQRLVEALNESEIWDALILAVGAEGDKKAKRGADRTRAARDRLLEIFQEPSDAVDLALFGRMIADLPETNIAGAVQVAHSLGVSRLQMELDYWTTIDDLAAEGQGAAMIGDSWFSSALVYDYTAIDFKQLETNLGSSMRARQALESYLWSCILARPIGRQNNMAAPTPPSLMLIATGDRVPFSLANAFIEPVRASADGNLVQAAVRALDTHLRWVHDTFGPLDERSMIVAGAPLDSLAVRQANVADMIAGAVAAV